MHELPDPAIFLAPALTKWGKVRVEVAGSIGLRITWDDGHNSGIYTWERLRMMCPCTICSPLSQKAGNSNEHDGDGSQNT